MPTSSTSTSTSPEGAPAPESPPAPRPRQKKRSQVARACDWCRVHRIKCDNDHPCNNCKTRGGQCSNSGAIKLATLPHAYREIERLRQRVQELEQELENFREGKAESKHPHQTFTPPRSLPPSTPEERERDSGNGDYDFGGEILAKRFWEGIHISTARSPQKTWYGSSSLFYFIGRINTFLTSALQQNHSTHRMLPNSASKMLDGPTTVSQGDPAAGLLAQPDDPITVGDYLTPTQEEYFLGLFWQSYYTSFPILDEFEFKEHYQSLWQTSDKERKPSALVDIILAVCMQYGMAMLPDIGRGMSAASRANVNQNDATIAGRWHYRRCQTLLSCELESPTISTLQCHILASIYLCCGSFQNMADNACGLAVRTAYMLGLHLEPPPTMPQRESEMRKRLWWTLYVLESKMSMKLGRPFLLHDYSTTCSLPADDREIAMLSGSSFAPLGENVTWLTWNLHNTKLMLAARSAYTSFYDKIPSSFNTYGGQAIAEKLDAWLNDVPNALKTKRQNGGMPFSTDLSPLEIEQFAPLWLQRQRLLLELMYHNLSTNLYRPAITFPPAVSSPLMDTTALKCAEHAMAFTHIMHQVLSSTTILAGWHEAFQWQWNSAMTLLGFVLAYPQGPLTPAARNAIDLSVVSFEIFGNSFAIAASAANIMSDLSAKVDLLMEQNLTKQSIEQYSKKMPDKMQLITNYEDPTDQSFFNNNFISAQPIDGPLSFDDETATEMQGVLAQSIDIFAAEAYNYFDWSSLSNNFPEQWSFTQPQIQEV